MPVYVPLRLYHHINSYFARFSTTLNTGIWEQRNSLWETIYSCLPATRKFMRTLEVATAIKAINQSQSTNNIVPAQFSFVLRMVYRYRWNISKNCFKEKIYSDCSWTSIWVAYHRFNRASYCWIAHKVHCKRDNSCICTTRYENIRQCNLFHHHCTPEHNEAILSDVEASACLCVYVQWSYRKNGSNCEESCEFDGHFRRSNMECRATQSCDFGYRRLKGYTAVTLFELTFDPPPTSLIEV